MLDRPMADKLAGDALGHVEREFPNQIAHAMTGPADIGRPSELHPIFFGSYDWHSCVHSYWALARLINRFPDLAAAEAIRALFARRFTDDAVACERAYFDQPHRRGFERPYGWAWLLKLACELNNSDDAILSAAGNALSPLAEFVENAFIDFWPRQTYPIRTGTHSNSAFATVMALDYARRRAHPELIDVLERQAMAWFAGDRQAQAWEPGGDEFLSPTLIEALCIQRVLDANAFAGWLDAFLPRLSQKKPATLFVPATVSDRSDGKIAHLDGLNLSRGWCWRRLADAMDAETSSLAWHTADQHIDAALPHLDSHYMGGHWLASFALLAVDEHG